MAKCTEDRIEFGKLGRRLIEADFSGGELSSDGGLMLLRRVDERIGLTRAGASVLGDPRGLERIRHTMRELLALRVWRLCCSHEDLNDHDRLRDNVLMQTHWVVFRRWLVRPPCAGWRRKPRAGKSGRCVKCSSRSSSPATMSRPRDWRSISTPRTSMRGVGRHRDQPSRVASQPRLLDQKTRDDPADDPQLRRE